MRGGGEEMKNYIKFKEKGFTLIELLVVIAIIGLLSTLMAVALNLARQGGRDAKRVADMKQVATALAFYFDQNGAYPAGTETLGEVGAECLDASGFGALCTNPYMATIPKDPSNSFWYEYQSTANSHYLLEFVIETGAGSLETSGIYELRVDGSIYGPF